MAVITYINGIYDLSGNDIFNEVTVVDYPTLEKGNKVLAENDNVTAVRIITPISSDYVRDITFLLNSGRTVEYQSFQTSGTIDVIYQGLEQTWNYYTYYITAGVLSDVALLKSSPVYYTARFREQDPLYYGAYDTAGELPLIADDPTLVDGNYATVGTTTFTSYEYDADLDQWDDLGFLKNQYSQTVNTAQEQVTVFPVVRGSETSATPSEIDIIKGQINDLDEAIDEILLSLKQQDVDGNFEPTNDEAWSSDKRVGNYLDGEYADKDKSFTVVDLHMNGSGVSEGTLSYDSVNRVAEIDYGNGVVLQIGEEMFVHAVNKSGSNLTEGTAVSLTGATGNKPQFVIATNTDDTLAHNTIGILTEDINNNAVGKVTRWGLVRNLDTSAFSEGDALYLGTNGAIVNVAPTAPTALIELGICVVSNISTGVIYVDIDKAHKLHRLSDVEITNPQVGDTLYYNGDTWINQENSLSNLTDVNIISPQAGEVLEYNGVAWVAGDVTSQGAGKSITFYIEDVNSSVVPYETLSEFPLGLAEEDDSTTLNSGDGEVEIGGYITEELGRTKIEAGNWVFETFARIGTPNKVGNIVIRVYKRASGGTETELFNVTTEDITQTTNQLYSTLSTQSEFAIITTDRLLVKYFATTTSVSNVTVTLVHSGTENASHIDTPLQTLHNDLAGLQGGASGERYHLTQAELLELQNLSTSVGASGVGYDDSTGFTGKTNVQDALDQAKADIDAIVLGGVADDSITDAKLGTDVKVGSNSQFLTDNPEYSGTSVYDVIEEVSKGTSSPSTQVYTDVIQSTFGTINPIELGSPLLTECNGLTLNQVVPNGDFSNGTTGWSANNATNSVTSGILSNTGQGTDPTAYLANVGVLDIGTKYFIKARARVTNADCTSLDVRINFTSILSQANPVQNQWYDLVIIDTVANGNLRVSHTYVDSATQNGKVMEVDYVMAIPIDNTPYSGLTASQINARLGEYIEGITDLTNPQYKSIGKNLADNTLFEIGDLSSSDGSETVNATRFRTGFIRVAEGVTYEESYDTGYALVRAIMYNSNFEFTRSAFPTPVASGEMYVRFVLQRGDTANITQQDFTDSQVQLEEGTSATDYTEYKSNTQSLIGTFRSVGSIRDKVRFDTDKYVVDRYVGYKVLESSDFASEFDGTNVQFVRTTVFDNVSWGGAIQETDVEGRFFVDSAVADNTNAIGGYRQNVAGSIDFIVALGTYANLSEAQTDLSGTEIRYKYDTPLLSNEEIDSDGDLIQDDPTTIIQEQNLATETDIEFSLNQKAQNDTNLQNIQKNQREIKLVEDRVDVLEPKVTDNETKVAGLYPVTLWSGTLAVSPVESTPPTNSLDSGDFDTYNYYRIRTSAPSGGEIWSRWFEFDTNGDIVWVSHITAMSNAGGSATSLHAKFERDSSTAFHFYAGTTTTSGTPTSTTTSVTLFEIQGRNV